MHSTCSIELRNQITEITRLGSFIEKIGFDYQIPAKTVHALLLASDELVTNTISYGYDDALEHRITIDLDLSDAAVTMTITDDGRKFDPLSAPEADTSIPLEEKKIGGLGIHLVKAMMDEINYKYENNRNSISMIKNFN